MSFLKLQISMPSNLQGRVSPDKQPSRFTRRSCKCLCKEMENRSILPYGHN